MLRALQQGQFEPCKQLSWSFSQNENSTPAGTNLRQEGWGPACIFCRRFVPKVWTGVFPDNPEAPARLCAQGFHFSLRGPSGEPASVAPGGGRPSPSFACPVRALTCYVDRTQSLRTSDQLLSVTEAGRKGMPFPSRGWPTIVAHDSGCHHPGLSGTGCALPVQVESSLYKKCGVLLGAGSWRPADR